MNTNGVHSMSDSDLTSHLDIPVPTPAPTASGGALLRQARDARGLHIGALAVALKVSVKKLEAIEADRFDLLPDIVFARALASSICRHLKIDATPILEKFPPTSSPNLKTDESGINTPFHGPGGVSIMTLWSRLSKSFVVGLLLILIAVLSYLGLPSIRKLLHVNAVESAGSLMSSPVSKELNTVQIETPVFPSSAASNLLSPPLMERDHISIVPGSGATNGLVVLKSHGLSWVEVLDAKGQVLVRKTMVNGEVLGATGPMPLSVVIGKADTVEVTALGKPFDLSRITKDNVARFEVK